MNNGRAGNSKANGQITPGQAKAWVIFKGGATQAAVAILSSFNVASVRRDGLGTYTITLQRPFKTPAFCYLVNGKGVPGSALTSYVAPTDGTTAGAKQIQYVAQNGAAYDPPECCFIAWGDQ